MKVFHWPGLVHSLIHLTLELAFPNRHYFQRAVLIDRRRDFGLMFEDLAGGRFFIHMDGLLSAFDWGEVFHRTHLAIEEISLGLVEWSVIQKIGLYLGFVAMELPHMPFDTEIHCLGEIPGGRVIVPWSFLLDVPEVSVLETPDALLVRLLQISDLLKVNFRPVFIAHKVDGGVETPVGSSAIPGGVQTCGSDSEPYSGSFVRAFHKGSIDDQTFISSENVVSQVQLHEAHRLYWILDRGSYNDLGLRGEGKAYFYRGFRAIGHIEVEGAEERKSLVHLYSVPPLWYLCTSDSLDPLRSWLEDDWEEHLVGSFRDLDLFKKEVELELDSLQSQSFREFCHV
jgi:hypothetical protein